MRGQVELPAVGIALLLLTVTVVLGVAIADNAFTSAERSAVERQTAMGLSDQLVGEQSPLTNRQNVINATELSDLDGETLRNRYGVPDGADAEIQLGGEPVAVAGDPERGTTIERIVLVERGQTRTIDAPLTANTRITLPRRTANATVSIAPKNGTTIRTVTVNERVVLAKRSGLDGAYQLTVSPYQTATFAFESIDASPAGSTTIEYYPRETQKATLSVTVDE
ncbi:DUF7263 family protein [Halovenus marina]|uniref:DUF7263 family protein n=1 Tax=Halovenus marina TaxID=3396621 RepID=UPI003F54CBF0